MCRGYELARTNPTTADPARLALEVVSKGSAFRLLRAALKAPGTQKDLAKRADVPQGTASKALREMFLIGLLELDDSTYSVLEPRACWEMLLGAARARAVPNALDKKALDGLLAEHELWKKAERDSASAGEDEGAPDEEGAGDAE